VALKDVNYVLEKRKVNDLKEYFVYAQQANPHLGLTWDKATEV
jgi:hypothetical protein